MSLILRRSPGQSIIIGENIAIKLFRIVDGVAQIGIDAPKDVPVHRLERLLRDQNVEIVTELAADEA